MLIKNLSIEQQELVKKRQIEQGRDINISLDLGAAFEWDKTPEGHDFWSDIHYGGDITSKGFYPENKKQELDDVLVRFKDMASKTPLKNWGCNHTWLYGNYVKECKKCYLIEPDIKAVNDWVEKQQFKNQES